MKRFKNIVYIANEPGIGSVAFQNALELAISNNAELTVLDVIEPMVWSAENQARFGMDLTTILRDRRLDELSALTIPHCNDNFLIKTQVAVGTPFLEIIRATLRNRFDLVIKNAEKMPGQFSSTLGPNDQHLVRKCPCPVWIDREQTSHPYQKILAAVDPLGDEDKGMSRMIMDLALSVEPTGESEVHVVHAWRVAGESSLSSGHGHIPGIHVDHLLAEQEHRHLEALASLVEEYGMRVSDPNVHFEKSDATALITRISRELPADLLVTGTVGRTGIPGFFIGNTAESLMHMLDISVLTVKPKGFVSPVTLTHGSFSSTQAGSA